MLSRLRGGLGLALILVAIAAPFGHAQQGQIPKELALALLPNGAVEGGEIIVGQLPPDLAGVITLPEGARILGSFVGVGYAHTVLTLPLRSDSALAVIRRSLTQHGWTARSAMAPAMGGLQYGSPGGDGANTFCKMTEQGSWTVGGQFYGPGTTLVHLTRSVGMDACAQVRVRVRQSMEDYPFSTVPPLWSPGDMAISSTRCRPAMGMGQQSQERPLLSDLTPAEVLDYYGRQLDSAGWKAATNAPESVSRTWSKMIESRGTQEVTVVVTKRPSPAGCYDISVRATGLPPR